MSAMKEHLEDLLEDYSRYQSESHASAQDKNWTAWRTARVSQGQIIAKLDELGYDIKELS